MCLHCFGQVPRGSRGLANLQVLEPLGVAARAVRLGGGASPAGAGATASARDAHAARVSRRRGRGVVEGVGRLRGLHLGLRLSRLTLDLGRVVLLRDAVNTAAAGSVVVTWSAVLRHFCVPQLQSICPRGSDPSFLASQNHKWFL